MKIIWININCCFFFFFGFFLGNFLESENYKYDRLSGGMRGGGGNRAPPQALYRPGSGPLRKSGRGDEFENDNNFHHDRIKPLQQQQHQQQQPPASIAYRLRNCQFPNSSSGQEKILQSSPSSCDIDDVSTKFNDLHVNYKNSSNHHNQGGSKLNHHHHMSIDPRKKNKKPEQQLYVPKKVKEALAERDVINR